MEFLGLPGLLIIKHKIMESKLLLQCSYLDIVFYDRNKAYGSYALRITYLQRMKRAGFYILSVALLLTSYAVWSMRAKPAPVLPLDKTPAVVTLVNPELDIPEQPLEPPAPPKSADLKTELFIPPEIVVDKAVRAEEMLATQEELKAAVAGTMKVSGSEIGNESLEIREGDPNGRKGEVEGNNKKVVAEIPVFVEQMPEFPGGEAKLMEYLSNNINYPDQAMNARQQGKVQVKFVVNEDGSISNVMTTRGFGFGSEQESIRVVSAMPRWKPGRNNGKAVKVWFQLPVIFRLN
jgi:protein TonB